MTIHRTRHGIEPSGGAEDGRLIIQLGDIYVEYSGSEPDQAELDLHLNPPPPLPEDTDLTAEDIDRLLFHIPGMNRARINQAKNDRGKPLP